MDGAQGCMMSDAMLLMHLMQAYVVHPVFRHKMIAGDLDIHGLACINV